MVEVEMEMEMELEVELRPPPLAARIRLHVRLHAPSDDAHRPLTLVYPPCTAPSSATSTSRNSAPMLSTCSFVTARTSKARTTAPMYDGAHVLGRLDGREARHAQAEHEDLGGGALRAERR